jgi:uncharacterized protein (DUF302 family)/uncharacterized membrane protein YoaK (UPF0700 family)
MAARPARPSGMQLSTPLMDAWRTIVPAAGDAHGPLPPLLLALTLVTGLVDAVSYLVLGHVFVANMTGNVVFLGFALAGASGFSIAASLTALGAFSLGALLGGRLSTELSAHRGRLLAVRLAGRAASKIGRRLLSALAMFLGGLTGALLVLHASSALAIAVASIVLVVVAVSAAIQSRPSHPRSGSGQGSPSPPAKATAARPWIAESGSPTPTMRGGRTMHMEDPQPVDAQQGATTDCGSGVITKVSPWSVADTVARLSAVVAARGMKQFAVIDHSGEAQDAGLELRDTKLVIFGSPQAGTPLMAAAPLVALDLPLRVLVWADGHRTQVSYTAPTTLAARYGLSRDLADRLAGIDAITNAAIER